MQRNRVIGVSIKRCLLALSLLPALYLGGCNPFSDPTAEEYLQSAIEYRQEGKLSEALIEGRNALQQNPEFAEARIFVGELELHAGDNAAAVRSLTRARELGIDYERLALLLARAHLGAGEHGEVRELAKPEGFSLEETVEWHYLQGRAALAAGDAEGAREAIMAAFHADPTAPLPRFGRLLLAVDARDGPEIRKWADLTLAVNPDNWQVHRHLGDLADSEGNPRLALEHYDQAVEGSGAQVPQDLYRRGLTRMALGDLDGAKADAGRLKRIARNFGGGYYIEGLVNARERQFVDARRNLEEALNRMPGLLQARLILASVLIELERHQQAETQLERYLAEADHPAASFMLARLRADRGDQQAALSLLDEHLERFPTDQFAGALRTAIRSGDTERMFAAVDATPLQGGENGTPRTDLVAELGDARGAEQPEVPQDVLRELEEILRSGEYRLAIDKADELLEEYPGSAEVLNLKAGALMGAGDANRALEAFVQAFSARPDYLPVPRNLGQLLMRGGHYEQAAQVYRRAHPHNPEDLQLTLDYARAEAALGNDLRALELIDLAIDHHPDAVQPRLLKGNHALQTGEAQTAIDVLAPIKDRYQDDQRVQEVLGRAYLEAGEAEQAVAWFTRGVEASPEQPQWHLRLGSALRAAGQGDAARASLQRAVELAPDRPEPRVELIRAFAADEHYDDAEAVYADAIEALGPTPELLALGGSLASQRGDREAAVTRFSEAYAIAPSDGLAVQLARAHLAEGQRSEAQALLEERAEADDEVGSAVLHLLGSLLVQQDTEEAEAKQIYERLIERNADDPIALNNLAWLERDSNPARAVALASRARDLAPDSRSIAHTLAVVKEKNGEVSEALALMEELATRDDAAPPMRLEYAEMLVRADRYSDAAAILRALAEIDGFDGAQRAQALLDQINAR